MIDIKFECKSVRQTNERTLQGEIRVGAAQRYRIDRLMRSPPSERRPGHVFWPSTATFGSEHNLHIELSVPTNILAEMPCPAAGSA
jgi:hypothetical protein